MLFAKGQVSNIMGQRWRIRRFDLLRGARSRGDMARASGTWRRSGLEDRTEDSGKLEGATKTVPFWPDACARQIEAMKLLEKETGQERWRGGNGGQRSVRLLRRGLCAGVVGVPSTASQAAHAG